MKTYQNYYIATRGFSLVELLVAMVIALVVMTGVINSFLASKDAYRYNQELAFIQENARFADSKMGSDIREAGNFGCSLEAPTALNNIYYANNLVNLLGDTSTSSTPTHDFYKAIGIQGYNSLTPSWPSPTVQAAVLAVGATTAPDVIMVRHGDLDNAMSIQSHDDVTNTFTLKTGTFNNNSSYKAGKIMVYADAACQYQAIFQSTGPAPSATTTTIAHNVNGGSVSQIPGNFATVLRGQLYLSGNYYFGNFAHSSECSSASVCSWRFPSPPPTYPPDSKVMPMVSNIYYIGKSSIDTNMNSLFVIGLGDDGLAAPAQELVLGVDDMRIYYGVDTLDKNNSNTTGTPVGAPDGTANRYVTADKILHDTATSTNSYSYLVWNRVDSVRIQLLMRSHNKLSSSLSQNFQWDDGTSFTKNDGYLRQVVSFTVQLRTPFRVRTTP